METCPADGGAGARNSPRRVSGRSVAGRLRRQGNGESPYALNPQGGRYFRSVPTGWTVTRSVFERRPPPALRGTPPPLEAVPCRLPELRRTQAAPSSPSPLLMGFVQAGKHNLQAAVGLIMLLVAICYLQRP